MSIPKKIDFACPKCHQAVSATMWETVNTNLRENLHEQIIDHSFFNVACPKCGEVLHMRYSFLYNDLRHGQMIWTIYPNEEDYDRRIDEISVSTDYGVSTRLVDNIDNLAEKVSALEAGRDDRVIEIYKVFLYKDLSGKGVESLAPNNIFYLLNGEEGFYIRVEEKMIAFIPFDVRSYNEIMQNYSERLAGLKDYSFPKYDINWALNFTMNDVLYTPNYVPIESDADTTQDTQSNFDTQSALEQIYCYKCGKKIRPDSIYCCYCGANIQSVPQKIPDQNSSAQAVAAKMVKTAPAPSTSHGHSTAIPSNQKAAVSSTIANRQTIYTPTYSASGGAGLKATQSASSVGNGFLRWLKNFGIAVAVIAVIVIFFITTVMGSTTSSDSANNTVSSDLEPVTVYNGQILEWPSSKCVAPLEVNTTGTYGYYIYLEDTSGTNDMAFYVKGGKSAEISVPVGTYEIYYATGKTWYGKEYLFGEDTSTYKCDETFRFYFDGYYYNGYTIDLYTQSNGNLDTTPIPENQFPGW